MEIENIRNVQAVGPRPATAPTKNDNLKAAISQYKAGITKPRGFQPTGGAVMQRVPFAPRPATAGPAGNPMAAKMAKLGSTVNKVNKVAEMKERWAKERDAKKVFMLQRRAAEMKMLHEAQRREAEIRKKNLAMKKELEFKKKEQERELVSTSVADRTHMAREMERMKKERRKRSVFLNNEILKKYKEKEAEIEQMMKIEEEQLMADKREDFLKVNEAKKEEERRKRESMFNRGKMAQAQKEIGEQLDAAKQDEERGLLDFRRALSIQKAEYEKDVNKEQAKDLEQRLNLWRIGRSVEDKMKNSQADEERGMIESKRVGWIDANTHKRALDQRRRDSLAFRLDEWRKQKTQQEKERGEQAEADEIEWQLKQQEHEDVKEYQASMNRQRRESLACRLEKARQDKAHDDAVKAQQALIADEEARIKDQDRADVEKYKSDMAAARRQSMQFRNQMEFEAKSRMEGERQVQKANEDDIHAFLVQGWRNMKAAQEEEKARARRELAEKIVEDRQQKQKELERHFDFLSKMHEELEVKHANWSDVQNYKKEEEKRRRQSVAMRLDSWRRERLVEEMMKSQEAVIAEEDARLREQDWMDLMAAKESLKLEERQSRLLGGFMH